MARSQLQPHFLIVIAIDIHIIIFSTLLSLTSDLLYHNLRKKRKIERVHQAVEHFEKKMNRRRKRLKANIKKSKNKSFNQTVYSWQSEYDAIMARKRST